MEHNMNDGTKIGTIIGMINSLGWLFISIVAVIPWLQAGALLLSAVASYYTIKKNKQKKNDRA